MLNLKRLGIVPPSPELSNPQKVREHVEQMLQELTEEERALPEAVAIRAAWGAWGLEQERRWERQQRSWETSARRVVTPYVRRMLRNPEPSQQERIALTALAENTAGLSLYTLRLLGCTVTGPDDQEVPVTVSEDLTWQVRDYVDLHGRLEDWLGNALGIVLLQLQESASLSPRRSYS